MPKTQETSSQRLLWKIAKEIEKDWKKVNYAARPYLDAMFSLNTVGESFGADSAESVVAYFLSNATTWRGETARRVKQELKEMLKRWKGRAF